MSNKQKWTPGPWHKAQTDKGRPKVVDRNGFAVATAGAQPYNHDNFVLMSAAPELFDALEALLETCHAEPHGEKERMAARAALAKARGEKP